MFVNMKLRYLILFVLVSGCNRESQTSELICEGKYCFTIVQKKPFVDEGNSGIYFRYGKDKTIDEQNNFVHVRYADAPFYYRWNNDTLVLRCPYWKLVENKAGTNKLFDFKDHFTEQEKLLYGYDLDVQQFYKKISKDFKKINTYELK